MNAIVAHPVHERRKTDIPPAWSLYTGDIYTAIITQGVAAREFAEAKLASDIGLMQHACERLSKAASEAAVVATLLERRIAQLRRRSPPSGVR